jgi:hypothetical protein
MDVAVRLRVIAGPLRFGSQVFARVGSEFVLAAGGAETVFHALVFEMVLTIRFDGHSADWIDVRWR